MIDEEGLSFPTGQQVQDVAHQLTPVMIPGECELGGGGPDYPASVDINGLEQRLSTNTGALMLPESVLSGEESAAAASETAEAPMKVAAGTVTSGLTPEAFEQLGEFAHQVNDDLPTESPDKSTDGAAPPIPADLGAGRGRVFYGTPQGQVIEAPPGYEPVSAQNGQGLVLMPERQTLGNNSSIIRWGLAQKARMDISGITTLRVNR